MWGILSVLTMSLTEMILSFQRTTSDGIGVLSHAYCALLRTRRIIFVSHLTIHFEMPTTSRWHYSRHYYRFEAAYPPSSGFFSLWRIRDTRPRKWELSDAISFALCSPYSFDTTKQPQIILWKRKKKKTLWKKWRIDWQRWTWLRSSSFPILWNKMKSHIWWKRYGFSWAIG